MSLPVILRPEAREEYDNAFDYHESQRAGLGPAFAARVRAVISRLGNNPKMHGTARGAVRKAVV